MVKVKQDDNNKSISNSRLKYNNLSLTINYTKKKITKHIFIYYKNLL